MIEMTISHDIPGLKKRFMAAMDSAKKKCGYESMLAMKNYILRGVPHPLRGMSDKLGKQKNDGPLAWFARIVGYRNIGKDKIAIGFGQSRLMQKYLERSENGQVVEVSEKIRRYLAIRGAPIKKSTKFLVVPGRPIIQPVQQILENTLADVWTKKFREKMEKEKRE